MYRSLLVLALGGVLGCAPSPTSTEVRFARETVDGVSVFLREAGPPDAPHVVLLHGFPSASHTFTELMPALAARYHVIAPDYPGFMLEFLDQHVTRP